MRVVLVEGFFGRLEADVVAVGCSRLVIGIRLSESDVSVGVLVALGREPVPWCSAFMLGKS